MRDSPPPSSSSFGEEEALREILSKILDQSVPSGAETSLETLAYAARRLKTESNRNRARIARKLKDAYGSGRSNEEEEFGDEEEREEVAECCERFCEEFLELLSEEETARNDLEVVPHRLRHLPETRGRAPVVVVEVLAAADVESLLQVRRANRV